MVVWVFAGGGESEVKGLIPFLQRNYTQHQFERKSPVRLKPKSKITTLQPGYGLTGKSLVNQLERILQAALLNDDICDLILVIDDLDCHDLLQRRDKLNRAIDQVAGPQVGRIIGFAAPEVEAWIIADWDQTLAQDIDFRGCEQAMRHWMSVVKQVLFSTPETFSEYDPDKNACAEKLSDVLIEATERFCVRNAYSKAIHTPRLLEKLSALVVSRKCPLFRDIHHRLREKNA